MTRVIATHQVKDQAHWLASPKRAEAFATIGVTDIQLFTDPQNPNMVGVSLDVPDMDALMAALQSPEFAAAMEHDGVLAETLTLLTEA